MKVRQVLLAAGAVALLCACGSPGSSGASPPDGCAPPGRARVVVASVPGGADRIRVTVFGKGPDTVVLSNESDEDLCSWLPPADHLTAAGYRVALWDYGTAGPVDELTAVTAAVRAADPPGPVVLLGASEGAKASLVAAAGIRPPVVGVVSLSAEAELAGGIDVESSIGRIGCPLLLLTATDDPYGSAPAARSFLAAARPGQARLLTLPGAAHGTALLQGPTAAEAQTAVDEFLHTAFGAAGQSAGG
ncbi:alpha/beta hydrolase [Kitasatospora viridis]|uniref:Alpha/beta hydrolase n=1 Tax=Kitasatospora viridis TaxID=281105 RepID=A0A561UG56_9ACTN|nr:alpha/beta hydrolase [Kitasatospora viridis]TWF98340.1 hypothetical protein FHX73_112148 [Kitasatospora viridis]